MSGAPGYSPLEERLTQSIAQHRPSLFADGVEIPGESLLGAARAVAARLVADGIPRGSYVLLAMQNSAEYLAAALGVMFAGARLVPVNTRFTAPEVRDLFDMAGPAAWIADSACEQVMREAAEGSGAAAYSVEVDPVRPLSTLRTWGRPADRGPVVPIAGSDIAVVFFTAGTTGRPKGALTTHAATAAFTDIVTHDLDMTARDTVLLPMPMFYSGGLKASLANLLLGARVVTFRQWKPADLVDAFAEHRATFLWAVPSVWALMLRSPGFEERAVQTNRVIWRGGSHTPRTVIEDLSRLFPGMPHFHSYGQTECNMSAMERDALAHKESVGFPTFRTEITIEGHRRPDEEGEIWLRGPQQFSGYLGTSTGELATVEDGWVHSGDRGWFGADGRLYILGRGSDIVIRGGENISTAEVERTILDLPGVAEAAVVAVPDEIFANELKAVVVAAPDVRLDAETVREGCRGALAEFKIPKYVEIREDPLPKSGSGKIDRSAL